MHIPTIWKKTKEFFTISKTLLRTLIIINAAFLCYHIFWIGISLWTAIILQLSAFIIEYLVSSTYEKMILKSNRKVNEWTRFIKKGKLFIEKPIKAILFIGCFLLIYISVYHLRLQFFCNLIHWGVTQDQLVHSTINSLMASPIFGIAMGFGLIKKIKEKRKKERKRIYINSVFKRQHSPSV
jgi:hypothetical protein